MPDPILGNARMSVWWTIVIVPIGIWLALSFTIAAREITEGSEEARKRGMTRALLLFVLSMIIAFLAEFEYLALGFIPIGFIWVMLSNYESVMFCKRESED
ncbi:hypothetical protein [Natronoglycomyces albus]|uniref:DUF2516 family protein n=1 Tax=Natronoglycomyces albus TaxID=2811108 RepID=A0A895XLC7_9ACTN|nr:hypothetical protein [Natronoglycomyces albus]QSB05877.1 hypothetical protein JQS30_02825 [Natronoglycomyces albus]